ncbi:hypothetical protein GQR36_16770 [Enterococcus termitis]
MANIQSCGKDSPLIMSCADLFIQEVKMEQHPEVIVRFGMLPISKNTMFWLQSLKESETTIYFVDETGEWQDQLKQAQLSIQAEEQAFIQSIKENTTIKTPNSWRDQWIEWQKIAEQQLQEVTELNQLTETSASILVHKKMTTGGQLFVSNSNAIRFWIDFRLLEIASIICLVIAESMASMELFRRHWECVRLNLSVKTCY